MIIIDTKPTIIFKVIPTQTLKKSIPGVIHNIVITRIMIGSVMEVSIHGNLVIIVHLVLLITRSPSFSEEDIAFFTYFMKLLRVTRIILPRLGKLIQKTETL